MNKYLKYIFSMSLLLVITLWVVNAEQVMVSAVVWSINKAPTILSINPNSDPKLIARNKTQNYIIYFNDAEKDTIYYTLTPQDWYTDPISWEISSSSYDSASWAYINFKYLAPNIKPTPNPTKVTLTINDWPNLVSKDINLYIY